MELKQLYLITVGILSGVITVVLNSLLKKALSDIPRGFLLYEAIIGAFIGVIISLIIGHFVLPTRYESGGK